MLCLMLFLVLIFLLVIEEVLVGFWVVVNFLRREVCLVLVIVKVFCICGGKFDVIDGDYNVWMYFSSCMVI